MKQLNSGLFMVLIICILLLAGCNAAVGFGKGNSGKACFDKDASYALGYCIGSDWVGFGIKPDFFAVMKGIKAAYGKGKPRYQLDEAINKVEDTFRLIQETKSKENTRKGTDFLEQNSKKEGIITTSSGLQYEVLSEGSGIKPGPRDTVKVNYEGTFIDGKVFDCSAWQGGPRNFRLFEVIAGWTEGIQLMSEGSSYRFYIPSELAYGSMEIAGVPANSVLIFTVDLLSVEREQ